MRLISNEGFALYTLAKFKSATQHDTLLSYTASTRAGFISHPKSKRKSGTQDSSNKEGSIDHRNNAESSMAIQYVLLHCLEYQNIDQHTKRPYKHRPMEHAGFDPPKELNTTRSTTTTASTLGRVGQHQPGDDEVEQADGVDGEARPSGGVAAS